MNARATSIAAVEIERRDHRFAGARQDRRLLAAAAAPLPNVARIRCSASPAVSAAAAQLRARTSALQLQRQRAFGIVGIERVQLLRDHQAQHAVAEKFQPLVGACPYRRSHGSAHASSRSRVLERMAKLAEGSMVSQ